MRYNSSTSYQARCVLAEKLADIQLRKWCVEQIGSKTCGPPDLVEVDALFMYVKLREKGTNVEPK